MNTAATATPTPRAFLPGDLPTDKILIRAVLAHCVAAARDDRGCQPADICREFWPRDAATLAAIERSATAPATTSTTGWAAELAAKSVAAFIGSLQTSAAAALITAAPRFDLPGYATITLPGASATGTPQWAAEGAPVAVPQAVINAPQLGPPRKLTLVEAITREVAETSVGGGEAIIETILRDALGRALDLSVFSATAADATRPAGILNGLTPLAATTGGGINACLTDLRLLIEATVTGGGSGNVLFACSPGRALAILTYAPSLAGRVLAGAAVPDATLAAVDPNAFCSMFGPDPEIRANKEATLHFEDSVPLQLSSGTQGSATVATPTRSLFQTDTIALRAILRCAWVMRVPGAVSVITSGLSW